MDKSSNKYQDYSKKFESKDSDNDQSYEIERVVAGPFDYSEGEDNDYKESYLVKYVGYDPEYTSSASRKDLEKDAPLALH